MLAVLADYPKILMDKLQEKPAEGLALGNHSPCDTLFASTMAMSIGTALRYEHV